METNKVPRFHKRWQNAQFEDLGKAFRGGRPPRAPCHPPHCGREGAATELSGRAKGEEAVILLFRRIDKRPCGVGLTLPKHCK